MMGRIKVLIGGLLVGMAVPVNVWDWLRETARNPEITESVFIIIFLVALICGVVMIYRNIEKE